MLSFFRDVLIRTLLANLYYAAMALILVRLLVFSTFPSYTDVFLFMYIVFSLAFKNYLAHKRVAKIKMWADKVQIMNIKRKIRFYKGNNNGDKASNE